MEEKFEFQANFNGDKNISGSLIFLASGVEFYEDFVLSRPLEFHLNATEIVSIDFIDTANEVYQPGIFSNSIFRNVSFLSPKKLAEKILSNRG